jgi:hypothetical protein
LEVDPAKRLTAADVLASEWVQPSQQAAPSPCIPVDSEALATPGPGEGVRGSTVAREVADGPEATESAEAATVTESAEMVNVTESAEVANVTESAEVAEMTEVTESEGVRLPDVEALEATVEASFMTQQAEVSGRREADRADKVRLYALCQAEYGGVPREPCTHVALPA